MQRQASQQAAQQGQQQHTGNPYAQANQHPHRSMLINNVAGVMSPAMSPSSALLGPPSQPQAQAQAQRQVQAFMRQDLPPLPRQMSQRQQQAQQQQQRGVQPQNRTLSSSYSHTPTLPQNTLQPPPFPDHQQQQERPGLRCLPSSGPATNTAAAAAAVCFLRAVALDTPFPYTTTGYPTLHCACCPIRAHISVSATVASITAVPIYISAASPASAPLLSPSGISSTSGPAPGLTSSQYPQQHPLQTSSLPLPPPPTSTLAGTSSQQPAQQQPQPQAHQQQQQQVLIPAPALRQLKNELRNELQNELWQERQELRQSLQELRQSRQELDRSRQEYDQRLVDVQRMQNILFQFLPSQ
ncbi:hypothetical protein KEM55_004559 [Ascosphaera atra]|nr:hypothetical protein KEM55_004559 [Ascosphaera atra]